MAQATPKSVPDVEALQQLLSDQRKISSEIDKQLKKFEELQSAVSEQSKIANEIDKNVSGKVVAQAMMKVTPEKIRGVMATLSKKILAEGKVPVLVLTTTNYKSIQKVLEEDGVDPAQVMLIDCVTRNVFNAKNTKNINYVDSLRNLTQLQIKVIKFFEKNENSTFVFDSLDTLELYHDDEVIFKFVHSLTKILRQRKMSGYYLFGNQTLIRQLSQFFDSIIEIK